MERLTLEELQSWGSSNIIKSHLGDLEVILAEEFAQLTKLLKTDFASLMLAPDKTFQSYSIVVEFF